MLDLLSYKNWLKAIEDYGKVFAETSQQQTA